MLRRILTVSAVVIIVLMALQVIALAAEPVPDRLYVRVWPEYQDSQVSFLTAVQFAPTTPLPINVKVAIPKGATITWAGEILGGKAEDDIQAMPKMVPKDGYDEVTFTLTRARIGQVETTWPGLKAEGDNRSVNIDWVQRYEAKDTVFELREPSQATELKISPLASDSGTGPDGARFYSTAPIKLDVGQKQTFSVTYKRSITGPSQGAGQPAPTQGQQPQAGVANSSTSAATVVLIMFMATVIVFVVYMQRKSQNRSV